MEILYLFFIHVFMYLLMMKMQLFSFFLDGLLYLDLITSMFLSVYLHINSTCI